MKKLFVSIILLIFVSGIVLAAVLPSKYVVPVLMYHHVAEKKGDILYVPTKDFDKQMKFLKDRKYNVIPFKELVDLIVRGKKFPRNTVVITLDDGYEDNYTNAYPILKKYNIPSIIFALPGHCGLDGYLTKYQIKELSDNGIDIGSHTMNDVWLPSRSDKEVAGELTDSKNALEEITGNKIDFFCYPLGGFDGRIRAAVMKAGYKGACATNPGRFSANNDIYALKRLKVSGKNSANMISFWFKTTGYATWFKEHKRKKHKK